VLGPFRVARGTVRRPAARREVCETRGVFWLVIELIVTGLVVGALGRLVVPGPNPMGIGATIAVGLAGTFLGGLLGRLVFGWRYGYSFGLGFLLAVGCTAMIVLAVQHHERDHKPAA